MKAIACSIMCMGMWVAAACAKDDEPDQDVVVLAATWILIWAVATVLFLFIGD